MSQLQVNRINDASGGVLAPISSVMRNRIINGAMVISQRNGTTAVTPTNADYTLDRWQYSATQASKFTVQQGVASLSVLANTGFNNYIYNVVASTATLGAGDLFTQRQAIEGFNISDLQWGTANAKSVTLSFWVYSNVTGTHSGSIANGASNRCYVFSYSVPTSATWTKISVTIAGDTSGTWAADNSAGMYIRFNLGAGSTYLGTAGSWGSTLFVGATGSQQVVTVSGGLFHFTGVQLEVGTQATSFEYRQYGTELALCQRYFTRLIDPPLRGVIPATNEVGRAAASLPVTMRASPTSTITQVGGSGQARFYDGGVATGTIQSVGNFYSRTTSIEYDIVLSVSGYVTGRAACLYLDANYSTAFNLTAEL